jgi:acyl-homoserine-lactone acylase
MTKSQHSGWFAIAVALAMQICATARAEKVDVHRTAHGVVHIDAVSDFGAAFGLAYAYASDNVCLLADYAVTIRGERSRHFGPQGRTTVGLTEVDNLTSDRFFRYYVDDAALSQAYAKVSADEKQLLLGYIGGYNRFLHDTAGDKLPAACRRAAWVLPLTEQDMYRMLEERAILLSGSVLLEGIVAAAPPAGSTEAASSAPAGARATAALGSNGWAFGADATAHGGGLLLANPHFPWETINRMYQVHLKVRGQYDVMGATLPPFPAVTIGFNRDVAWTHTVSTAQRYTLFELRLVPDDPLSYFVDGTRRRMTRRDVTVPVRQPDGSIREDVHAFYETVHGPVVSIPQLRLGWTADRAYAVHDVNRANTDNLGVWRSIARARSVADVRSALAATRGIGWVNTIAADRDGNAMLADLSRVPNVSASLIARCAPAKPAPAAAGIVLDGTRTECLWYAQQSEAPWLAASDLPVVLRRDYVANSNDSYWLVNAVAMQVPLSPILGPTAVPQRLRTRIGLEEIQSRLAQRAARGGLTAADLEAMLFSNRNHSGELFADDLVALCAERPVGALADGRRVDLADACSAVARWDRRNDLGSRGAALFREFWIRAKDIDDVYAIAFDPNDPVRTPRGLNRHDPQVRTKLIAALAQAQDLLARNGFRPDARLGEIQAVVRNGRRIEIHGGAWYDGVLNLNLTRELTPSGYVPYDGASYIQIVTLGRDGPRARGVLAYGQSVDPASPYYTDQTELYSRKQLYDLPFTRTEILADPEHRRMRLEVPR